MQCSTRQWLLTGSHLGLADLTRGDLIGQGSFGRVRIGKHASGNVFAVKTIDKSKLLAQEEMVDQTVNERSLLSTCNHPFLLRLVSAHQSRNHLYLVTELVLGGELHTHLQTGGAISLSSARFYAANVLAALVYLKKVDVLFRDLKTENILLGADGYLKVIDFGFAKIVDGRTFTFCGTPEYMPPEVVRFRGQSLAVDMWALGVLVYEMLVGKTPFEADMALQVFEAILDYSETRHLSLPWFFSGEGKALIELLLNPNAADRPTPDQLSEHEFFSTIDFVKLEAKQLDAPFVPKVTHECDTSNLADMDSDDEGQDEVRPLPRSPVCELYLTTARSSISDSCSLLTFALRMLCRRWWRARAAIRS
jgi:serine/threonine protein kinase